MSGAEHEAVSNRTDIWFLVSRSTALDYYKLNPDVTIDYVGDVHVYHTNQRNVLQMPLLHIPNYVGDNKADGKNEGIRYLFDVPQGSYQVEVNLIAKAGCGKSRLYINETVVAFTGGKAAVQISNPRTAEVRGGDDVCYYVLRNIVMTPAGITPVSSR